MNRPALPIVQLNYCFFVPESLPRTCFPLTKKSTVSLPPRMRSISEEERTNTFANCGGPISG